VDGPARLLRSSFRINIPHQRVHSLMRIEPFCNAVAWEWVRLFHSKLEIWAKWARSAGSVEQRRKKGTAVDYSALLDNALNNIHQERDRYPATFIDIRAAASS